MEALRRRFFQHPLVSFLFFFGVLARFINLNQSLWLDEAITAMAIQKYSLSDLVFIFAPTDFHPPLYYLFLQIWSTVFGTSEISLRLPSVLFSLIATYFVYRSGKLLSGKVAIGLWSAVFFLWNPLILYYSQEARMYLLAVVFISVHFYALLRLMREESSRYVALIYVLSVFGMLFTFYGSVFYLATVVLYLLWKRSWRVLSLTIIASGLGVLMLSPLLVQQWQHSKIARIEVSNWSSVLGTVSLKNAVLIPVKLTSGRISFEPKWIYYALASGWLGVLAALMQKNLLRHRLLLVFLFIPGVLGMLFSVVTPLLQYFRFLYLVIFLSLLLGMTLKQSGQRVIVACGFVAWSLGYLLFPVFHREDWRILSQDISSEGISDLPVYMISTASDPLTYYLPDREIHELSSIDSALPTQKQVIVIPYVVDVHGIDSQQILQSAGFTQTKEDSVRGISWQIWQKAEQP